MARTPCCDEKKVRKGKWTREEDRKLTAYVTRYGCWNWRQIPKYAGLARCGKSCRLRWLNYLRPNIKRGSYTKEEEETIIRLHQELGNRWSAIAQHLPGRTDNEIKNHWHSCLKKRFIQNPSTSSTKPERSFSASESGTSKVTKSDSEASIHTINSSSTPKVLDSPSVSQQLSSVSTSPTAATTESGTSKETKLDSEASIHTINSSSTPKVLDSPSVSQQLSSVSTSPTAATTESWSAMEAQAEVGDDSFWTEPFVADNLYCPPLMVYPEIGYPQSPFLDTEYLCSLYFD